MFTSLEIASDIRHPAKKSKIGFVLQKLSISRKCVCSTVVLIYTYINPTFALLLYTVKFFFAWGFTVKHLLWGSNAPGPQCDVPNPWTREVRSWVSIMSGNFVERNTKVVGQNVRHVQHENALRFCTSSQIILSLQLKLQIKRKLTYDVIFYSSSQNLY